MNDTFSCKCYFCGSKQKFESKGKNTCTKCGKIDGELYAPFIKDECRICNTMIWIAVGEQPSFTKNGYCSPRCAGEWSLGTSDDKLEDRQFNLCGIAQ